ncbi:MAG: hypothetical protein ACXAD7_27290, partial [Candidatus Kariarchaeaceae archaeon]
GDNQVTITIYDQVNNPRTFNLVCYLDDDAPTIFDISILEISDFTHFIGGASPIVWYSNGMSSDVTIYISVSTDDGLQVDDSGVQVMEFPAIFNIGSAFNDSSRQFNNSFLISSSSSTNGSYIYRSIDNCGNIELISLDIIRDNQVPSGFINSIDENSIYVHKDPSFTKLWYSNYMGSSVDVSINLTVADPGSNSAGIFQILFPTFDEDTEQNLTEAIPRTYHIDSSDITNEEISFTVYDNVGNTYQVPLQVIKDLTLPSIQFVDISDPIYDPDTNELDFTGNWFDQEKLSSGFLISSSSNDPLSGLRSGSGIYTVNLTWDSTASGNDQTNLDISSDHTVTGLTDDSDGNITITLFVYDNVGNSAQTNITIRFDNTAPTSDGGSLTPEHQNGKVISLFGATSDNGSDIQNITIDDLSVGTHFSALVSSNFANWLLDNNSDFNDVTPGDTIIINVTIFDNVNNAVNYTIPITYHLINFLLFDTSQIPQRVEIDEPMDWNITIDFRFDGSPIGQFDPVIDRVIDLSQFSVSINGTDLQIKPGSLEWITGPKLQFTVILPNSSSSTAILEHLTIGESWRKDISVEWKINTATIGVLLNRTKANVVSYHDLEVSYVSDNRDITETDNPDVMNITLHLEKDGAFMENDNPFGSVASENLVFTVSGDYIVIPIGSSYIGSGNYKFSIQLPSGLPVGDKDINFTWQFSSGSGSDYEYVVESNSSAQEVSSAVKYHDIEIIASVPTSMQLFEIDGDFYVTTNFTISENDGTGFSLITNLEEANLLNLSSLFIQGNDFLSQATNFVNLGNGDYSFDFEIYGDNMTDSWIGDQNVSFPVFSPTGLYEIGYALITSHDFRVYIQDVYVSGRGIKIFDPDERTIFELDLYAEDEATLGIVDEVTGLNNSNFINIFFENTVDTSKNTSIELISNWEDLGGGNYKITFVLEFLAATQVGVPYGYIKTELKINDSYGHIATFDVTVLISQDFVTLLELEWIETPFRKFTFDESNDTKAADEYTYRVSLGQTIIIYFKIYALQDPGKNPISDTVNIIWESPWNTSYPVQNIDASGHLKLNLTSNQPWREIFVSYEEFNREKQLQLAPWRFNVEWDEITAEATITDDNEADLVDNVLNVDGNYSLTYSTSFERSNKEAGGSQYFIQINLSSWNLFTNDWDSFTGTLVEYLDSNTNITYPFVDGKIALNHLDGNGSRKFTFLDGILPVGNMSISDIVDTYLFADGAIDLQLQFYDVFKADIMLQTLNETGPSIAYREYTTYSGYPGTVFSSVDETSNATLQETIIWTKLRVTISTPDSRIPTLTFGTIIVEAFYAHDPTIFLDNTIRVYLADSNNGTPQSRIDWSNNKVIFSNLLSRGIVER